MYIKVLKTSFAQKKKQLLKLSTLRIYIYNYNISQRSFFYLDVAERRDNEKNDLENDPARFK